MQLKTVEVSEHEQALGMLNRLFDLAIRAKHDRARLIAMGFFPNQLALKPKLKEKDLDRIYVLVRPKLLFPYVRLVYELIREERFARVVDMDVVALESNLWILCRDALDNYVERNLRSQRINFTKVVALSMSKQFKTCWEQSFLNGHVVVSDPETAFAPLDENGKKVNGTSKTCCVPYKHQIENSFGGGAFELRFLRNLRVPTLDLSDLVSDNSANESFIDFWDFISEILTARDYFVLEQRVVWEQDAESIAEVLGITAGTVRDIIGSCIQRLEPSISFHFCAGK